MYRDSANTYFTTECHVTEGGDTSSAASCLSVWVQTYSLTLPMLHKFTKFPTHKFFQ